MCMMGVWDVVIVVLTLSSRGFGAILQVNPNVETSTEIGEQSKMPVLKHSVIVGSPSEQSEKLKDSEDMLIDCQSVCNICKATGKIVNGNCLCFSDNGGEVVCIHLERQVAQKMGLLSSMTDDLLTSEDGHHSERNERCIGALGSTRGSLQNILGQGLGNASSTILERTANFRKRVEALRSLVDAGRQKQLSNLGAITPTNTAGQPLAPAPIVPVSPFTASSAIPQSSLLNNDGVQNLQTVSMPSLAIAPNQPEILGINQLPGQPIGSLNTGIQIGAPPTPPSNIPLPMELPGSNKDPLNGGANVTSAVGRILRSPNVLSNENQHKSDNSKLSQSHEESYETTSGKEQSNNMRSPPLLVGYISNNPITTKNPDYSAEQKNKNYQDTSQTSTANSPGNTGMKLYNVINGDLRSIDGVLESLEEGNGMRTLIDSVLTSPQKT